MITIDSYKDKKLIEHTVPGGKYLVRFGHGVGDTIMFMPLLERLRALYPDRQFDLYVETGQEQIWESATELEPPGYDVIFVIHFPMSEGSDILKAEKCAYDEIGLSKEQFADILEVCILPEVSVPEIDDPGLRFPMNIVSHVDDSPLVGVHFQGTALPDSVNCDEAIARQIWHEIESAGKVPIEVHFRHTFHNPINKRFDFVSNSCRDYRANLKNLFAVIQRCSAFIGVASGPFVAAMSIMPERTMYLEKNHPLETYTRHLPVTRMKLAEYQQGMVYKWLGGLAR